MNRSEPLFDASRRLRIGSTCSGYGGLEIGIAAALGGEAVWHAEIDPAASRVLAHRWPGVPNLGDITTTNWPSVPPIDVLAAGFPCQQLSLNGRRAGLLATGQESLVPTRAPWEGVVDAIRVLRPQLVIVENVRGLLSAPIGEARSVDGRDRELGSDREAVGGAFGRVLGDLADLGFDAEWLCDGASDLVGAAHRRRRVFVVAAAADAGGEARARWARLRPGTAPEVRRARPDDGAVDPGAEWGHLRPAIDRWARVVGRPAPAGLVLGPDGGLVTSARFMEWLMGLPAGHVCDVPGISQEAQRRLLGNGVVPEQAEAAIRHLLPRLAVEVVAA